MPLLVRDTDGDRRPLVASTVIGRSTACALRLQGPHASSEHANARWTKNTGWTLCDLDSKNGTFLDGKRLAPGREVPLRPGAKLAFGAPEDTWTLDRDAPPGLVAIEMAEGRARWSTLPLVALPSDERPVVTLLRDSAGRWVSEGNDGVVMSLADDAVVQAGRTAWRVHLPASDGPAKGGPRLDTISMHLAAGKQSTPIDLEVHHRRDVIALAPGSYSRLLLALAQRRLDDAGRAAPERGWVDRGTLMQALGMDSNTFDAAVHQARLHLLEAGVGGGAGIVEVRRRQRRFGLDRVTIRRA